MMNGHLIGIAGAAYLDFMLCTGRPLAGNDVSLTPGETMLLTAVLAVGLNYWALAALLNSTRIEVSLERLRMRSAPLPWHFPTTLEPGAIRDVVFREIANPGYSSTFEVFAISDGGVETKILGGLQKYEHAHFYVCELRSILNLPLGRPLQPLGG